MKKLFSLALAVMCSASMFATDYYLQGGCVPSGWSTDLGNLSKCQLVKIADGVYQWEGIITASSNFKITTGASWGSLHPSEGATVAINEVAQSVIREGGNDDKWIVTKGSEYTITLTESGDKRILTCNRHITGIDISEDGYFHVKDAASWATFAGKLKQGVTDIDVKLDTDLTITEMLANNYCGTFDGQGHTITADLNAGGNEGGIFGIVSGGTYKNIVAEGTIRNASQAGFIGKLSAGTATIENVIVKMDIEGTANVAGLVGTCDGKTINFKNVIFAGKAKYVGAANANGTGGFLGWAGSCTFNLENCAMIGDVDISGQPQKSAQFIRANNNCTFNMKNCAYIPAPGLMYVNGHSSEANANATIVENTTDGKLCYLLNGDQTKINFYQTLGEDNIPTIVNTHKQVYASGRKHCDGTDYEGVTYNNESGEKTTDEHNYVDNVCDYCKKIVASEDGYFHVTNAAGWDAFIGNASANANVKVKLETDITIHEIKDCFSGTFSGTLDGQGHTITYAVDASSSDGIALFRKTAGAVVKNLNIAGSIKFKGDRAAGIVLSSGITTIENVKNSVNITADAKYVSGFISNCKSGILIAKNCEYSGNLKCTKVDAVDCGGFIGKVEVDGSFRFTDCVFSGEVLLQHEDGTSKAGWGAGGFVGKADPDNITAIADCYFTDCAVTGEIRQCNGAERAGGFIGSPNNDKLSYITKGCLMAGKAMRWKSDTDPTWEAQEQNVVFGCTGWKKLGSNTSAQDCYFTSNTGVNQTSVNGFTRVDHSLMGTGALCYMLNGDQSDKHWYQTLGDDAAPTLSASSAVVEYVGQAGYATMVAAEGTKINGNAQAYIGTKKGEYLTLTEVADVPAGVAVVLKGTYYNKVACTATADCTANDLKGSATESVVSNGTYYALAKLNDVLGFYKVANGTTIPAGKAYLTSESNIKGFIFADDNATGISPLSQPLPRGGEEIYNLAGQRMNKVQKGINIIGGKKVLK